MKEDGCNVPAEPYPWEVLTLTGQSMEIYHMIEAQVRLGSNAELCVIELLN
jgi:hypothetical protein